MYANGQWTIGFAGLSSGHVDPRSGPWRQHWTKIPLCCIVFDACEVQRPSEAYALISDGMDLPKDYNTLMLTLASLMTCWTLRKLREGNLSSQPFHAETVPR